MIYLWSGIRKGDLKNLISVINPHTKKFVFRTGKTGEISEIPAFDTLIKIAEKYNYNFPEPVHDTIVLKEIKGICKLIPSTPLHRCDTTAPAYFKGTGSLPLLAI